MLDLDLWELGLLFLDLNLDRLLWSTLSVSVRVSHGGHTMEEPCG
jgi:hypothetical protein